MNCIRAVRNKNGNSFTETRMKIKPKYYFISLFCFIALHITGQHSIKRDSITRHIPSYLDFKPNWTNKNNLHFKFVQSFTEKSLPFFCKVEHNIEKDSKIQFRFRLGELNYVNMLENK